MYIATKELPSVLRSVLSSISYGSRDISVITKEKVSLIDMGGAGRRAFSIIVCLATGETKEYFGSWGGANMFNPNNQVDLDDKEYVIPEGFAVIQGSESDQVFAKIILNPRNIVPWLPAASDTSDDEQAMLAQFRGLKPAYRQTRGKEAMIDSLVARGYLKRSKNGATQITTLGKNACEGIRVS